MGDDLSQESLKQRVSSNSHGIVGVEHVVRDTNGRSCVAEHVIWNTISVVVFLVGKTIGDKVVIGIVDVVIKDGVLVSSCP